MINDSKKETWKFIIQVIISILTAIATALGTTSCMSALAMVWSKSPYRLKRYGDLPIITLQNTKRKVFFSVLLSINTFWVIIKKRKSKKHIFDFQSNSNKRACSPFSFLFFFTTLYFKKHNVPARTPFRRFCWWIRWRKQCPPPLWNRQILRLS